LIQKVSQELGFIWHFISVYRWQEAFVAWSDSILNSEVYSQLFEVFRENNLNRVKNELGLFSLAEVFGQEQQTISIQLLTLLIYTDINGESGRLGIRTRHPEEVFWASYAGEFIVEKFRKLPEELRSIIPDGLHSWQKPVVYLPVVLAYQSINSRF